MAKTKAENTKQKVLEQENIILRKKLADQERLTKETIEQLGGSIATEIKKIRQKGRSSANRIEVISKHDHKNISLWTKAGKRVGPMHPDNAIQTLNRFADIGVVLSADQPTDEQIQAYKQTAEFKKKDEAEKKRRVRKDRSKRSGQMERFTAEIAKQTGVTIKALNRILPREEVGKK